MVNEHGIHVDLEEVLAILELSASTNIREVRRVLGMASCYRGFIRNFAGISASSVVNNLLSMFRANGALLVLQKPLYGNLFSPVHLLRCSCS